MIQDLERYGSLTDVVRAAVQAELRLLLTALPGIVQSGDGHRAKVISAIDAIVRSDQGAMSQLPFPQFQTLPIHFTGGGNVVATHPVTANDEGIILFMARAIDSWAQSGGTQNPIDSRQHHASDGVYLGGIKSDPNTIPNYVSDSHQVRTLDGKVTHEVHETRGVTAKAVAPTDTSTNPWAAALKFIQSQHIPGLGFFHTTTDNVNTHTISIQPLVGMIHKVLGGSGGSIVNTISSLLSGGIVHSAANGGVTNTHTNDPLNGIIASVANGAHVIQALVASGISLTTSKAIAQTAQQGITLTSATGISLSAPSVALPAGSITAANLGSGAAATSIGALGGDLSGSLPSPTVVAVHLTPLLFAALPSPFPAGQLCYITDATSRTNGSTAAGGGTDGVIVKSDGSAWIVLG